METLIPEVLMTKERTVDKWNSIIYQKFAYARMYSYIANNSSSGTSKTPSKFPNTLKNMHATIILNWRSWTALKRQIKQQWVRQVIHVSENWQKERSVSHDNQGTPSTESTSGAKQPQDNRVSDVVMPTTATGGLPAHFYIRVWTLWKQLFCTQISFCESLEFSLGSLSKWNFERLYLL